MSKEGAASTECLAVAEPAWKKMMYLILRPVDNLPNNGERAPKICALKRKGWDFFGMTFPILAD